VATKNIRNAPSSTHIVANYDDDRDIMRNNLLKALSQDFYPQNYTLFLKLLDAVMNVQNIDWAIAQAEVFASQNFETEKQKQKAKTLRTIAIEALNSLRPYLSTDENRWLKPAGVIDFHTPVGVKIPIKFLGIYRYDGKTRLCLMNYWKTYLTNQQICTLIGLARYYVSQYPEYDGIDLEFVDISCLPKEKKRQLDVYGWNTFPSLAEDDLTDRMSRLAEAYLWAQENKTERPKDMPRHSEDHDPNQYGFGF